MTAEQLRRAGQPAAAADACREALARFPGHLSMRVTLGWALLDQGQFREAREAFELVRAQAPDNLAAIRGLAELHTIEDNQVYDDFEELDGGLADPVESPEWDEPVEHVQPLDVQPVDVQAVAPVTPLKASVPTPEGREQVAPSPERRVAPSPERRVAPSPERRVASGPERLVASSPEDMFSFDWDEPATHEATSEPTADAEAEPLWGAFDLAASQDFDVSVDLADDPDPAGEMPFERPVGASLQVRTGPVHEQTDEPSVAPTETRLARLEAWLARIEARKALILSECS